MESVSGQGGTLSAIPRSPPLYSSSNTGPSIFDPQKYILMSCLFWTRESETSSGESHWVLSDAQNEGGGDREGKMLQSE